MAAKSAITPLSRWAYNLSGFNKYGLMRNDILRETPEVQEAIRRLPGDIQDARVFRIRRAIQLSLQKIYLPKEEWTQIENDVLYLEPYLKEVREEKKSLEKWNSQ